MDGDASLSLGEWAVLARVRERPTHGWPIVRALAADGEIGAIWTVRRASVYRALETLTGRGLIAATASETSPEGPERTIYRVTRAGQMALDVWLAAPVEHVRDLRSALLLKLVFGDRIGADPTAMLMLQEQILTDRESALEARLGDVAGSGGLLIEFRLEATRAGTRFVRRQIRERRSGKHR
ncbi:MAG TPA: helix-turn-helix transcriptional regulator [Gaiellales bacterium]|nr:helix-turn-helix transcriptional regulator [Gaiellales bacterium]